MSLRNRPLGPSPQNATFFQSPPNSGGNDGTAPLTYDEKWQFFTNLVPGQIAWFQAQPEWQNFLAYVALSPITATAGTPALVVNSALLAAGQILVATPKLIIAL